MIAAQRGFGKLYSEALVGPPPSKFVVTGRARERTPRLWSFAKQAGLLRVAYRMRDLASDAAAVIEAAGFRSAHVFGISMGGMIAQELALAHPELVRTLTLGCTYCGGEGSALTSQEVFQKLGEAMLSGDRERALRVGFEVNVTRAAEAANPALYEQMLAIAEQRAVAVPVIMAQVQACSAHDTGERLASLRMPTLVVHGTEDQMLPVQNGHAIAARIPGARLEILDGTGHLFFWEQPHRSAELVREHAGVGASEHARA